MQTSAYCCFNTFIVRTPLFGYEEHTTPRYQNVIFDEALFLASADFYREQQKYLSVSGRKDPKIESSLYKYYLRACTRATPFGLFAGCSVGKIGEKTEVRLEESSCFRRVTRLDMNYICAVVQALESEPEIRSKLSYYPNDSIYYLGGKLRYVEYYYAGIKRIHQIAAVETSEYLSKILDRAQAGATLEELSGAIVDEEVEYKDAECFVNDLIDAQILKSNLQVAVTGEEPLERLIKTLEQLLIPNNPFLWLKEIRCLLKEIDQSPAGEAIPLYRRVEEIVTLKNIPFDPKFLFQVDMYKPTSMCEVAEEFTDELLEVLSFLNKATLLYKETNLSRFKKNFRQRYEQAQVPLLHVMDTELGIGYLKVPDSADVNPLVDNIVYSRGEGALPLPEMDRVQWMLMNKYTRMLEKNEDCIRLCDEDLVAGKTDWKDTPLTFSVLCNVIRDNSGGRLFQIKSAGGASAAGLLGRFCPLDTGIYKFVKSIAEKEQELHPGVIFAEIAHLPESRIGNIVFRPVLREYEIDYLAAPGCDLKHRIPLSDLTVSVEDDQVILRSVSLNKRVIPRMSNAHNFFRNSMPVYHFLCDLQTQDLRYIFGLNTGALFGHMDYLPRIMYKNAILSPAQWKISMHELAAKKKLEDESLLSWVREWRLQKKIPRHVTCSEGDNALLIDLETVWGVRTWLQSAKQGSLIFQEFFCPEPDGPIQGTGGVYCGEFIFSFYKKS